MAESPIGRNNETIPVIWRQSEHVYWWIGVCNACQMPVLVMNEGGLVFPSPRPSESHGAIPDAIRKDLDEAKTCYAAGAFRASAVISRRAMQAAALDRGASNGALVKQIDELAATGKITLDLKEWAHAVRWAGNDAAHPGGSDVTKLESSDALELAEQFLHVLYVAPALAAGLRKRIGK